jgi:O-phosphoseryl-tRNA(Cys) synthetase
MEKGVKDKHFTERYQLMTVRLARHLKLTNVDQYVDLPVSVRETFCRWKYTEIVLPLIVHDKEVNGLSLRQLEIKYGVPKSTIDYHLKK